MHAFLILCLIAAASASPANLKTGHLRAQVTGNGPIILEASGNQVLPTCSTAGDVTLQYVNTAEATAIARITIGTPGETIAQDCISTVSPAGSFSTLPTRTCGRTGSASAFEYSVTVVELLPTALGTLQDFPSSFTVTCNRGAAESLVEDVPPEQPKPEGAASFTGTIPFQLERGTQVNPRQWNLVLSPTNGVADLVGLSYRLDTLRATAATDSTKTALLVNAGCPVAGSGVTISPVANTENVQTTTIAVRTFQFADLPGGAIDFTATAVLCTNPGTDGSCPAVVCPPPPVTEPEIVTETRQKTAHRAVSKRAISLIPGTASVKISV